MAMVGGPRGRIVSEINVTPMADVMIVLLPYARVQEVLRACREADAEQVVLVTDPKVRG